MRSMEVVRPTAADALRPADVVYNVILAPGSAKVVAIPTDAKFVIFGTSGQFCARYDGAAAAWPVGDVIDGNGSELNPTTRFISLSTSISLAAPAGCVVSLSFHRD